MLNKITLKISGMHCTSCAMNIDFDLEDLEGVKTVSTNYARQETQITYDSAKLTLQDIEKVINNLNYSATVKE